ncbi:TonB-dependent receptor, partial [Mesorhizobium sp. M1E.F.Ca.ET.063.01.1.1]
MASGIAILMAGAAAIALGVPAAKAQQAVQPATDQQADQKKKADEKAAAEETLLDKILVISRTGETAIQSLASASHVDKEQLDRRMATTPNEMLLGVPGVT